MTYDNIVTGTFVRRINRFVAEVIVDGKAVNAHVRNTGRCTRVISSGAEVSLQLSADSSRKTPCTLIAVNSAEFGWVNLDSLAPNKLAGEWLKSQGFTAIRPEFPFNSSRIDFYAERNGELWLVEVKGCTLAENGFGLFPDAPTERGRKHLRELALAKSAGYRTMIAYVIMLRGIAEVVPNAEIDPDFAEEYAKAVSAGVLTAFIPCVCTADSVSIR